MVPEVARMLRQLRWPGVDAVTYGDGRMTLLEVEFYAGERPVFPLADTTLESYLGYHDEDDLSAYDIAATVEHGDHVIAVGDGSGEGNGVVVVTDKATGTLAWFAFYVASDPFVSVTATDGVLDAVTAEGVHWHIRVDDPLDVRVVRPPRLTA